MTCWKLVMGKLAFLRAQREQYVTYELSNTSYSF